MNMKFPICLIAFVFSAHAATPILIDFNMAGRPIEEGNESGYTDWAVGETAGTAKLTISGVTFALARNGGAGTAIKSTYYKAGVQAPHYARLVGDALSVVGGNDGASIRVTLTGLSAGNHTLQAYHNAIDGYQHGNIKVVVNGTTKVASLAQTNRVLVTANASSSFVSFTSTAGQTITIDYTSLGSGTYKNVFLNNLSLDVANPAMQATTPVPADHDFHADADDGSLTLSWKAAVEAKSHDVYFGLDSASVAGATKTSSEFKRNQTTNSYEVTGLSNLKVYWWRVDEVDANGIATPSKVWSFSPRHLAFKDAEGYGRFARGGRGGKVVHVTNLNDDGAGSLREAVTNDIGPRTIVFDVGGVIQLKSRLTLGSSFVTVAGQTAPGKGIMIRSAPFGMSGASDIILRFMKVRLGYGATFDGMGMQGADHSIFDHNSISWTIDEAFSSRSGKNLTLQRTMIAEALNVADHQNYPSGTAHGYAATIGGDVGSFHHNLLAHCEGRNWSLGGGLDGNGYYAGRLDIFNNVVYNWNGRATDGGAHQVNFVSNYYKEGNATGLHRILTAQLEGAGLGSQSYYYKGNILQTKTGTITCDGTKEDCGRTYVLSNGQVLNWTLWVSAPFFPSYATIQPAKEAYKSVLSDVGMTMPMLDDHDKRIIKETLGGTNQYVGSKSGLPGLPDRESDVGGYESYPTTNRDASFDTDADGMPNWWETFIGTSPNSAKGDFTDANADRNGDGYTNLEDYLEYMATPHVSLDVGASSTFNLKELFRGYSQAPVYKTGSNSCLGLIIADSLLKVTAQSKCGLVYLPLTVTDKEGSAKTREVGIFVNGSDSPVDISTTGILRPSVEWKVSKEYVSVRTNATGTLSLVNLSGRVVAQSSGQGTLQIPLKDLTPGAFVARFQGAGIREQRLIPGI